MSTEPNSRAKLTQARVTQSCLQPLQDIPQRGFFAPEGDIMTAYQNMAYDQAIGPLLVRSTTVPLVLPLSPPLTSTRTRLRAFWRGVMESITRTLPQMLHRSHSSVATQSAHTSRPKPHRLQSWGGFVSHRIQRMVMSFSPIRTSRRHSRYGKLFYCDLVNMTSYLPQIVSLLHTKPRFRGRSERLRQTYRHLS